MKIVYVLGKVGVRIYLYEDNVFCKHNTNIFLVPSISILASTYLEGVAEMFGKFCVASTESTVSPQLPVVMACRLNKVPRSRRRLCKILQA